MVDPPRRPGTGEDGAQGTGRGSTAGTPRWVKLSGLVALVLLLALIAWHLAGGGVGSH